MKIVKSSIAKFSMTCHIETFFWTTVCTHTVLSDMLEAITVVKQY